MNSFGVLLLAAGKSSRFGQSDQKKPFIALEDRAVWIHSAERFLGRDEVKQVVVVVAEEDREEFQRRFGANLMFMGVEATVGGDERSDSVRAGLEKLKPEVTHVAVHDAARPCVSDHEIDRLFATAAEHPAAILATPVTSTLKRAAASDDALRIDETVSRENLWAAQTPQLFEIELLRKAHASGKDATDDAHLVEQLGQPVLLVEGSAENLKITTQADLRLAAAILQARPRPKPDGVAHPFADDDLWR